MSETEVTLGQTYYRDLFFNLGVDVTEGLGRHLEEITIILGNSDDAKRVKGVIRRTDNDNGTPRIKIDLEQRRQYERWLHNEYQEGDKMRVTINNPNSITLHTNH